MPKKRAVYLSSLIIPCHGSMIEAANWILKLTVRRDTNQQWVYRRGGTCEEYQYYRRSSVITNCPLPGSLYVSLIVVIAYAYQNQFKGERCCFKVSSDLCRSSSSFFCDSCFCMFNSRSDCRSLIFFSREAWFFTRSSYFF